MANGILEIKDALANHLSVLVAIQIFDDLYQLKGPDSVYNTFGGANHGGHAVAAVGYDDQRYGGALRIINSWSQSWGDGGYFWVPYSAANHIVNTPNGPYPVLAAAAVLEDLPNPQPPPPDPVHPTPPPELPDLQVSNWKANFNGTPGGAGSLQYTITNTGTATAPAGAYVALLLSHDPTFRSSDTLIVYEPIPFEMPPGTTAYRDENNAIGFTFPADLQPGQYYMGLLADIWNDVAESNEDDNVSPATTLVDITNTLPDMEVLTWYSVWNAAGDGLLIYNLVNNGASTAPAGWAITLVLSPNDTIGDGDEIFLFAENASFAVDPGGTLYRNDASPASFSLYVDYLGNPVPTGVYYVALWLDPGNSLAESNETNNASLSWGTVGIAGGLGADGESVGRRPAGQARVLSPGEAYNGRTLAGGAGTMRKVRISEILGGGRRMEPLGAGADSTGSQRRQQGESTGWPKVARARQQVIFPVVEMKSMPKGN